MGEGSVESGTVLLQQAIALHRQGELLAAEQAYLQVLSLDPQNFDALHLLGVTMRQRGEPARLRRHARHSFWL